jgi:hypothetical protein
MGALLIDEVLLANAALSVIAVQVLTVRIATTARQDLICPKTNVSL